MKEIPDRLVSSPESRKAIKKREATNLSKRLAD